MPAPKSKTYGNLPHPASPGLGGAVKDAMESIAREIMPKAREPAQGGVGYDEAVDSAVTGKPKNQHTDHMQ